MLMSAPRYGKLSVGFQPIRIRENSTMNNNDIYYIKKSEILRKTQWHIFYIFTSEDIDHVTFSIYTIFRLGLYIINRTLHGGLKIWLLSSRVKNNILLTHSFSPLEDKSHIFAPPCNILYLLTWHDISLYVVKAGLALTLG
jgi:hypothetical protein